MLVVVVTFNSAADIGGLLECLPAALDNLIWTIAVVDNASDDDTLAITARTEPRAVIHRLESNRGYAAGINTGVLAHPGHAAVVVLNADVRLDPGSLPSLVDALGRPGVGIVVPRLVDSSGQLIHSIRREDTVRGCWIEALFGGYVSGPLASHGQVVTDESAYGQPGFVDWASGPVMVFTRESFDTLGGWDESFFLYSEETDFCLRARDAELATSYLPTVTMTHFEGDSTTSGFLWSLLTHNRHKLFRRRNGRSRSALHWLGLVVRESLRSRNSIHAEAARALLRPRRLQREVRQRQSGGRSAPREARSK